MRTILLCLIFSFAYGQKETNKWVSGGNVEIDFSGSTPTLVPGAWIASTHGCTDICDTSGQMLFYTNGEYVRNRLNQTMANGSMLPGSQLSECVVVKKQGTEYYLFTIRSTNANIDYSVIDMSLAGGLGSVTVIGHTMQPGFANRTVAATMHCNGKDHWVLTDDTNVFYAYHVSASGVSAAVTTTISNIHTLPHFPNYFSFHNSMRFSPDGRKLVKTTDSIVQIFNFDAATGIVAFNYSFAATSATFFPSMLLYSAQISPEGSKLYAGCWGFQNGATTFPLIQWDLCAGSPAAIKASGFVIDSGSAHTGPFGQVQIGPDQKMYVAFAGSPDVGVISNPSISGSACGYSVLALATVTPMLGYSLPNFVSDYGRQKPAVAITTTCGAAAFSVANSTVCNVQQPIGYAWDFGEMGALANTSTLQNTTHVYSANGSYNVQLVVQYNCKADTIRQWVYINTLPSFTATTNKQLCKSDAVTFTMTGADSYSINGVSSASVSVPQIAGTTLFTITATQQGNSCAAIKTVSLNLKTCAGFSELSSLHLNVYPVPVNDFLHVQAVFATGALKAGLNLYDQTGRRMNIAHYELLEDEMIIDVRSLAAGMYVLFLPGDNRPVKFAVER